MYNFQVQAKLEEAMLGFFHEANLKATVRPKTVVEGLGVVDVSFWVNEQKLTLIFYKKNGKITPFWVSKEDYNSDKLVITYNEKYKIFVVIINDNENNKVSEYIKNL
jgi:hypothetical protein